MQYVVNDCNIIFVFCQHTFSPQSLYFRKTGEKNSAFCRSFLTFYNQLLEDTITCQPFCEQRFWYITASVYILVLVYLGTENLCRIYEGKGSVGSK